MLADVRCRGLVLGPHPVLDPAWQIPVPGHRGCGRQVVGRRTGLFAFLSEMDDGLGGGVPENGELDAAETVCGSEGEGGLKLVYCV